MNLTPEHIGMLKGITATAFLFSAGIAVGLFFLHRKHEEELDKLESDTAKVCLDMASEHYESVIRRREKKIRQELSEKTEKPDVDSDEFQKEMDAMNNYEEPDEDWNAMHEEIHRHMDEYTTLAQQVAQKNAECKECLKKLGSKIYAGNDLIIKEQAEENTEAADD